MSDKKKWFLVKVSQNIEHAYLVQALNAEDACIADRTEEDLVYSDDGGHDFPWEADELTDEEAVEFQAELASK